MAKRLDVQAVLKKWTDNTANATESMKAGVNAVTVNPAQQAAASSDLWQQRVSSQEAKDKFQSGLSGVSLNDWKQSMLNKGATNMANGVRAAGPKMQKFLAAFLPVAAASAEQIASMPKGTEADSINRMVQNMRNMRAFRKNG